MSTIFADIIDAMDVVMVLHNKGCDDLKKHYNQTNTKIGEEVISSIVIEVATEVSSYNLGYRVHPTKLDITKVLTFSAAAIAKQDPDYSAVPLFYAYIDFIDSTYNGTGMTLRSFGESIFYAENLNTMLKAGQWMAPFCFFRGINLSFDKCAIPRFEGL
jgi:hypothetical protein